MRKKNWFFARELFVYKILYNFPRSRLFFEMIADRLTAGIFQNTAVILFTNSSGVFLFFFFNYTRCIFNIYYIVTCCFFFILFYYKFKIQLFFITIKFITWRSVLVYAFKPYSPIIDWNNITLGDINLNRPNFSKTIFPYYAVAPSLF